MKAGLVALLLLAMFGCSQSTGPDGSEPGENGEAVSAASCVKLYSPSNLKEQTFAFDGTITTLRYPPKSASSEGADEDFGSATFKVHGWYKGGSEGEVSLDAGVPLGAITSADFPSLEVGKRYLVSGEEKTTMHACGFTREHSDADGQVWKDAFGS